VTPFFIGPSAAYQFFVRTYGATVGMATRVPGIAKMLARGFRNLPDFKAISPAALDAMVGAFERAPPKVLGLLLASFADARPVKLGAESRCLVLVGDDDPVAPAKAILARLATLDFPLEQIEHLIGAAHMPHLERLNAPEITARNIDELARHVESMLSSSREGTPLSTAIASTVFEVDSRIPSSRTRETTTTAT
jgi:pimeloyl-ACP methyl ester carboxylesterase